MTKYLCLISKSCFDNNGSASSSSRRPEELEGLQGFVNGRGMRPPEPFFKRLHALYIIHDVLSFASLKLGRDDKHAANIDGLAKQHLQDAIPILAQLAVCADGKRTHGSEEVFDAVQRMLISWETHQLLPTPITSELHASLQEARNKPFLDLLASLADEEAQATLHAQRAQVESTKWKVPTSHSLPHDPAPPWHDLPAANGLFQRRTQGYPLRAVAFPPGGYYLHNAGQRADETMQKDVEELLTEAKRCFDKYTDASEVQDIDALGNIIWKASTGRKRRNHWGWSYEGIERKRRLLEERYAS